ncbi:MULTISPECIES: DNA polymerase III subunit gamma/tau [unclassified Caballeronia]|uniref:DNA polymerase III subunit gamma/tau n=1 Tax=unclassified Caballeronia TaxID=2646786 RepID=UPI00285B247B|nr:MULTISPECIES: DNA polymerase III subunit gamma/tau [unclassified Caballeronia]MDR5771745.1 DNA polymerase III subunit gamma/tau [Caballeronia sp. LZ002]MDR5847180.1 DNA polymerase III subunit gamma/tau [Caballeronia sp. LZ003]
MTYQVLARKWRPKSFESLVGQEHVVRALTHALDGGRLHHAYLFTGTRGVGKTTLSRIFAKALNCETGVTSKPCGVCRACREIDEGRFVDYVEMDAASNRGVDEMAALLERAVYAPVDARFKVYMIDEVHMLTNHAFNAMLKTLEEPPPHVKFILATTDPQKIPVTVLSRCLQFNLKQMPAGHVVSHLENILQQESIAFEVQALRLLSRAADGSMRDALSLTDQAIAYSANQVTEEAVRGMLGALDQSYLIRLLDALAASDGAGVLAIADEMALRSLSFSTALQDLASLLHRIAWAQFAPASVLDEWPEAGDIRRFAEGLSAEQVQLFYQIATVGRSELGLAPDEYAGFTMTLLRMLAFEPAGGPGGGGGGGLAVSAPQSVKGARNAALAGAMAERAVAPAPVARDGVLADRAGARHQISDRSFEKLAESGEAAASDLDMHGARSATSAKVGPRDASDELAGAEAKRSVESAESVAEPVAKPVGASDARESAMADAASRAAYAGSADLPDAGGSAAPSGAKNATSGDSTALANTAGLSSASRADVGYSALVSDSAASSGAQTATANPAPAADSATPSGARDIAVADSAAPLNTIASSSDAPVAQEDFNSATPSAASSDVRKADSADSPSVAEAAESPLAQGTGEIVQANTPSAVGNARDVVSDEVPVASAPLSAAARQAVDEASNNGASETTSPSAGSVAPRSAAGGARDALEVLRSAGMRLSSDRGGRGAAAAPAGAPAATKPAVPKPSVPVPTPRRVAPRASAGSDVQATPAADNAGADAIGGSNVGLDNGVRERSTGVGVDSKGNGSAHINTNTNASVDNTARAGNDANAKASPKVIPPWEDMPPDDYPPPGSEDEYFSAAPDDGYMPAFDNAPDDMRFGNEPAPTAKPAPKIDATPLPPAVPLDPIGIAGEWATLAVDLPLKGIAYQLAFNSELTACDASSLTLVVPVPQYADAAQVAKLKTALTEKLGRALEVNVSVAPARRTAAALDAAERAKRQQQAEQEIRQDPFVQSLIRDFGASIVQGSIKPVAATGANPSGASSVR